VGHGPGLWSVLGLVDTALGRTVEGLGLFNILPFIQLFSNKIQSSKFENAKQQLPSIKKFQIFA
jgi:hypothetical protein